ncbi:hypothetical protein BJY04DRAFT_185500 [Aspergillus karnatakaensis]|uniref:uncharacterized protein n=1 Tax=Aspergillus karnatakaensis TaxID=1810916 RepID=UPI003CCDB519
MSLSSEAIIALAALFIACVPGIVYTVKQLRRWHKAKADDAVSLLPVQNQTNHEELRTLHYTQTKMTADNGSNLADPVQLPSPSSHFLFTHPIDTPIASQQPDLLQSPRPPHGTPNRDRQSVAVEARFIYYTSV